MEWLGIGLWDWLTLSVYFLGIVAIGIYTAQKIKDTADFFIGGRRFGKLFMVFFSFGAGTNGNQAVGVSSGTYRTGMSGIWWQWLWLFATPFYWLIAPMFRRMRAVTTGDYFDMRFSPSVGALYSAVGILQLSANIGVMLLGSGKVISALSGGAIPLQVAIPLLTVLFVFYGVAGGMSAAIVTDFVQGILTVVLSFMVLPFALEAVGGFSGLHEKIGDPDMFKISTEGGQLTVFYIAVIALNATVGIVCQPHIMGVCAAGRNEMDGRVGFAAGNLLKRVCTVAWMLTGLCAVVMYPNLTGSRVDETYGLMARELLPRVLPGLVGVFLASLLASVMSSCDAFMVSCSGLFTQNIYRRYIAPGKSQNHYIWVGRFASLAIVGLALWFAFQFSDVVAGLRMFWKLSALTAAAFWVGLFWRRTTVAGAWAGTVATFSVLLVTSMAFFGPFAYRNLPRQILDWETVTPESESEVVQVRLESGATLDGVIRTWRPVYRDADGNEVLNVLEEVKYVRETDLYGVEVTQPDGTVALVEGVTKSDTFKPVFIGSDGEALTDVAAETSDTLALADRFVELEGDGGSRAYEDGLRREWRAVNPEAAFADQEWKPFHVREDGAVAEGVSREVIPLLLDSWQIVFYLIAGVGMTILVSLFTKRVPKERLDRFYNCLRTPVGPNEPHLEPFTLPEGVEPGPANKLIDHPDLEIPKMSLVGIAGFLFFWLMVAVMISFVFWMATWGT